MQTTTDRIFIKDYLTEHYEEIKPKDFYREIFTNGELAKHTEKNLKGKYNGIAIELLPYEQDKINAKRYIITDELDVIDELLEKDNFIIISPISYAGRKRKANAARYIYGIAIDLDGIEKEQNIIDLFFQIKNEVLPKPTYVVWSGTGVHLYYIFNKSIQCYSNITKELAILKIGLTKEIWNKYITALYDKPQLQSLFQGFRMCGGITKGGNRTKAYKTGEKVTVEYLNNFVLDKYKVKYIEYKSNITLSEAKEKYPEWYEKRVINKQPKGTWVCKRDLYEWWKRRILEEATAGHRYYCCMVLAVYAKKCNISRKELEADAFSLLEPMEKLTTDNNNHFTREDILSALEMYNDNYITFPIDTIVQLTNLPIEKNKRNGRKMAAHIEYMNTIRNFKIKMGEPIQLGRKTKEKEVKEWRQQNPNGKKADCIRETGISKKTVYKYWNE